jgi:hypothetical protein
LVVLAGADLWLLAFMMTKISYSGYRFPPMIIQQAIWLYARFTLSFRDIEDSARGRAATMALLSTADGRSLSLVYQMLKVMVYGLIANYRQPVLLPDGRPLPGPLSLLKSPQG